jgi:hypothetical protein
LAKLSISTARPHLLHLQKLMIMVAGTFYLLFLRQHVRILDILVRVPVRQSASADPRPFHRPPVGGAGAILTDLTVITESRGKT